MTFRDYVFASIMKKISPETALSRLQEAVGEDLPYEHERVIKIFWTWFFELTREGIACWDSCLQSNDGDGLEAMILDIENLIVTSFITAIGFDSVYIDDEHSEEWRVSVTRVYTEVFQDYFEVMVPTFIPMWKRYIVRNEPDEGIED